MKLAIFTTVSLFLFLKFCEQESYIILILLLVSKPVYSGLLSSHIYTAILQANTAAKFHVCIHPFAISHLIILMYAKPGVVTTPGLYGYILFLCCVYASKLFPVISAGISTPILESIVGAISESLPPSRSFRPIISGPIAINGTGLVVCAVKGSCVSGSTI